MPRAIRPIRIEGDIAFVTLTKGYTAVIDAADVPLVSGRNWCALIGHGTIYAQAKVKNRTVCLHRILLGDPVGLQIDHSDGDGLNNRRINLRAATRVQNLRNQRMSKDNTCGFKGITRYEKKGKWGARIKIDGKRIWLGLHDSPEAAHSAYVDASARLHGDFGRAQ